MQKTDIGKAIIFYDILEQKNREKLSHTARSLLLGLIITFYYIDAHPLGFTPKELFDMARCSDRKTLTKALKELWKPDYPYITYLPGTGGKKLPIIDLTYLLGGKDAED